MQVRGAKMGSVRTMWRLVVGSLLLVVMLVVGPRLPAGASNEQFPAVQIIEPGELELVSTSWNGDKGNNDSYYPHISATGRFIAFQSAANNLVPDDTNEAQDIFLLDNRTDELWRIPAGPDGEQANGDSRHPTLSADGRFIAYESLADNLAEGDDNQTWDIYLYDHQTDSTTWVSRGLEGAAGNDQSVTPVLSDNGRFLVFVSLASNLVPDDTNGKSDVFLYDHALGTLQRVSVSSTGEQANGTNRYATISGNGRYVAYQSMASNLASGTAGGYYNIFGYDRISGETMLISRTPAGIAGNDESQRPALSTNGRYITFESWASDLVRDDNNNYSDVFVFDRGMSTMELASVNTAGQQANHVSGTAAISGDGRFVSFASLAYNLTPYDENYCYDIYVHDRQTGATWLVSADEDGRTANGSSISPALSASGRHIVFDSLASNLVSGDDNAHVDVFMLEQVAPIPGALSYYFPLMVKR